MTSPADPDPEVPADRGAGADAPTETLDLPAPTDEPAPTDHPLADTSEGPAPDERLLEEMARLQDGLDEIVRLRARDTEFIDKLHAENTTLRAGEHARILKPLLMAMLRLHDQMALLGGGDASSEVEMLRLQLVQALELAAGVTAFRPAPGERFDSTRHSGMGRTVTTDADADGTVARTMKTGFLGIDGAVLRPAEVEVARFEAPTPAPQEPATPVDAPEPPASGQDGAGQAAHEDGGTA